MSTTTEWEAEIEAGPSAEMAVDWIEDDLQRTPVMEMEILEDVPPPVMRKPSLELCEC